MSETANETLTIASLSDSEISKILGLTVKIVTNFEDEFTGVIYSIMKSSNLLVLLSKDEREANAVNSVIININHIKDIRRSSLTYSIEMDEILSPNLEKIFENEKKNTEKECLIKKAERDKENLEMYQKGHAIYEKFSKFYKCSYENGKISMEELDAFIEEPFNIENLHCENESTRKRLIRMIESVNPIK